MKESEVRRRATPDNIPKKEPKNQPIVITSKGLKYIIAISLIILTIQILGIKYFIDNMESTKPLEERTPWEAVKLLLKNSKNLGLQIFAIEPSLLRAVRDGNRKRLDLWERQTHTQVTLGVKETDIDVLHKLVSRMQDKGYTYWEKLDEDPRGVTSATERSYKVITTHLLLWVPVDGHTPMLIHLVTFFERHDFFWHAVAQDKTHQPPFDLSQSLFGKTEGSYSLFDLSSVHIDDVRIWFPRDPSAFLQETESAEFIECNHTQAHEFNTRYGYKGRDENFVNFQRKTRQLLSLARDALNSLGIPFWLSSGTCLGWYRECDLISYTTDVDIGIFIKDYQESLITAFENQGLLLTHYFGKVSDSLELSFLYGDLKLDIFFFYETDEYIWNGGTQASTGNKYKYIFPPFHLCWTEFLDLWVHVPCPTLPYIHANYGAKWMFPDKKWDWKNSPNNVVENGRWPKEEWDDVIQLYE